MAPNTTPHSLQPIPSSHGTCINDIKTLTTTIWILPIIVTLLLILLLCHLCRTQRKILAIDPEPTKSWLLNLHSDQLTLLIDLVADEHEIRQICLEEARYAAQVAREIGDGGFFASAPLDDPREDSHDFEVEREMEVEVEPESETETVIATEVIPLIDGGQRTQRSYQTAART